MDFQKYYRVKILISGVTSLTITITLCLVILNVGFGIPQDGKLDNTASQILQEKTLAVGNYASNFLILIPNEGHESPALPKEQRIMNQPYVPENIVINVGTTVLWLNGDVGHKHKITLIDENSDTVYDSGIFAFNSVSKPLTLNKPGKFTYSEANVNKDDPNFKMQGTITVIGKDNTLLNSNANSNSNITLDTIGFLMVPAKDMKVHLSNLENNGVNVLDQYTFKDLRGGQKGTGPEQTLLLLGTKNKSLTDFITVLKSITAKLPYS